MTMEAQQASTDHGPDNGHAERRVTTRYRPVQRVCDVAISRLQFGFSPRKSMYDEGHVAALVEVFDELPPVLVHAPTMRVIDGVHRVLAARARGERTISARLAEGSEGEAAIQAVQSNIAHGKPLTVDERESAALKVMAIEPAWSDRRIAEVCGLSPKTVARLRNPTTEDAPQLRVRVGRDGVARPTDPAGLRHRIAAALEGDPNASIRAIAERTGASQGTVRDVRRRVAQGEDVLPPKLVRLREREADPQPDVVVRTASDAYRSTQEGADFAEWFESRHMTDDEEWTRFVDAIPVSRVYEVADAARLCGGAWLRFASALEARANTRVRRNGR
jgi:ParB-like chromosome segregation protein Spo0J